jgi:hypothetical protein
MKTRSAYVDLAKDIGSKEPTTREIVCFVAKTGITTMWLSPDEYCNTWKMYAQVYRGGTYSYQYIRSDQTPEGYPYFIVAGIKFILLCGDKLETVNLLR